MTFETESVLDRRRLRRRLSLWRVLAVTAAALALGLLLYSSAERAGFLEQRQIARVTIEGLIARMYQIGDSEAIIVGQKGKLKAQTLAHSPTGFAVEAGFLDQREALHHEERHLVSNFLGANDMRIDMGTTVNLQPRDTILLASDGLTDNLRQGEIIETIRRGSLLKAGENLAAHCAERMETEEGKPDDMTFILFRRAVSR